MANKILLKDASLLNEEGQCIRHQDVLISNGKIEEISDHGTSFSDAEEVIDCSGYYVSPGLPNLHVHTAMNIFKGIAEDVTSDAWFNEMIWPYESKMTGEDVYIGTLLGIAEMINNGVTVFADHYFGENEVLKAVKETGIRADLAPTIFGASKDFPERLDEVTEFIRNHKNDSDRVAFHMGPHADYTCPDSTLSQMVEAAKKLDLPLHLHLAEESGQISRSMKETGLTPFGVLDRAGAFDRKVLIAHGLWIQEEDLKYLKEDTWFAFCPKTYMKLASGKGGFFDLCGRLNYSFGTDGAASSNTLNPIEQARLLGLLGKFLGNDATAFHAQSLWKHLMAGHKAFSFGSGLMKKGAPADLVIWDLFEPDTFPFYHPISGILYSSNSTNVKYTMVAGKFLKYNGELKLNVKELMKEGTRLQTELLQRGKGKAEIYF